jgi:hypothetical protein
MTAKAPALTDILTVLIRSDKKGHRTLERGLTLAYTPGSLNDAEPGVYRLTLSRHGTWPGEQEIGIVKRDLWTALIQNGRIPDRISVEPWLRGKRDVHYCVLFWREGRQGKLL